MDWPSVADLVDQGPWYRNQGILLVNLCVVLSLLTSYTNGFDGSMANGLQLIQQWHSYFGEPEGSTLGLLTSVQNIGGFIALPFAPFVSDGLGRRNGVFIGGMIMLGGVALQSQSVNVAQFIAARGLIGFGMTFSINAAPLLVTELAYPTQRGPITAVYNTTWYLGSIASAWITFGASFASSSDVNMDHEAKAVLGKYHGNGDIHHPLVEYEYNEIREAIAMEDEVGKISWKVMLASPGNRRRLRVIIALGFFSQWSGNGLVSYYINLILEGVGITNPATKTLINGILQLFNYGMAICSSFFVDRIGRRRLFLISNTGMLVVFVFWTVTSALFTETGSKVAANATIVMIFLYYTFYDIAWTPLLVVYTVEILPYRLRAKGFAAMSFTVSLALVFNQYVNPVALDRLGWKYYLFYVGWLAFELFFVWMFFWETKGRTLEQTAVLFDGEDGLVIADIQMEHQTVMRRASTQRVSNSPSSVDDRPPSTDKSELFEMTLAPPLEWEPAYMRDRHAKY
ncbi:hypothetical protein FRB97_003276 [Tulasnella sp. 331]|nr:hypothetical protein FRB97_003276 [Tulasnella sp. 331]